MSTQNSNSDGSISPSLSAPPPAAAGPTCVACGEVNSLDSRFCRHCGAAVNVAAPMAQAVVAGSSVAGDADAVNAAVVSDRQRSRQLLDRSFLLAERGDRAGAILSCRQAIALAPDAAPAYSMLGLLLERTGETAQAIAAYQKVLLLAPDSRLEQESLHRLQADLTQRQFAAPSSDVAAAMPSSAPTPASPPSSVAPAMAAAAAASVYAMPQTPRPTATPFDAAAPSNAPSPSASVASILNGAPGASPAASGFLPGTMTPMDFGLAGAPAPLWKRLSSQPSFYFRGAPLVAATVLGLLWMSWARSSAPISTPAVDSAPLVDPATGAVTGASSLPADGGNPSVANGQPGGAVAPSSPSGATVLDANGFPVQNHSLPSTLRARQAAERAAAPRNTGARVADGARSNGASNGGRTTFVAPNLPRPVPPSNANSLPPANTNSLPPAQFDARPSQSVPALPPVTIGGDNGASSSGGAPLNPAGSSDNAYISIGRARPNRATAPVRPSNRAAAAERNAANDLRAGRTDRAIETLSPSLDTGGDTGWRYQQRALAFLQSGDNQRAADDFQTAISAYRDRIRRGENVREARSALDACQSGLRLALSNLRR